MSASDSPGLPDPLRPGFVVHDRYRIEAELTAQPMGRAYRATDIRFNRVVAVVVLAPHLRDELGRARFQRAVREAALDPTQKAYDYAEWEDILYAVVEHRKGIGAAVVLQ